MYLKRFQSPNCIKSIQQVIWAKGSSTEQREEEREEAEEEEDIVKRKAFFSHKQFWIFQVLKAR